MQCVRCEQIKPVDQFIINLRTRTGYGKTCLSCSTKTCTVCKAEKHIDHFRSQNKTPNPHVKRAHCISCERTTTNQRNRVRYQSMTPEQRLERSRRHRASRAERDPDYRRGETLQKYNMTIEQYKEMSEAQNGLCAICKDAARTERGRYKKLVVDHCHQTNQVRKLLCNNCNSGLGFLFDNQQHMKQAQRYLQKRYPNLGEIRLRRNKDMGLLELSLWKRFRLNINQYHDLITEANLKCEICEMAKPLVVDHDHKTGRIRGVLCSTCNQALGMFDDNQNYLQQAIAYLQSSAGCMPTVLDQNG